MYTKEKEAEQTVMENKKHERILVIRMENLYGVIFIDVIKKRGKES